MKKQNQNFRCRGIERILESKFIEADKNLLFALAFEKDYLEISDMCNKIAEDNLGHIKIIGRFLLSNAYNPKLNLNAEIYSLDIKSDFYSKAPHTAVSVINYNLERLKAISQYTEKQLLDNFTVKLPGFAEILNRVILNDIENMELCRNIIKQN